MKASEFRINNLVKTNQGVFKVYSIEKNEIYICPFLTEEPFMVFINTLERIPLTKEWLLRFGFEYDGNWHWTIGENPLTKDHIMDICWIDGYKYPFYRNGHFRIEYVHQLQNLYFALTYSELILK